MVKPDVKHNYYSDLDLPITASCDDIRKAYRKLALQYHPDRNAGRESEVVPRFQAIQAANEVLSDPAIKARYDQDRRAASLYPGSTRSAAPTGPTGNPYKATSAYPPPPRRTQPGTWQRPQPTTSNNASGSTPTGADRFANFQRPASAASKSNPAADRKQQYARAWQNMNNGPERPPHPQSFRANQQKTGNDSTPPRKQPPPPPPRPNPTQNPRTDLPSEEKIRAGFAYKTGPSPPGAADVNERTTAWQHWKATQAAQAQKAKEQADTAQAFNRSNTQRTPRRGGFDPNAPGSDERPAPSAGTRYSHRMRSEDLGTPIHEFPPPPPGPPPGSTPESPLSPNSYRSTPPRPPFTTRSTDDSSDPPFSEPNRVRTPYSNTGGEKTRVSSGLFRSMSTKDTTRMSSGEKTSSRAKSTSPVRKSDASSRASQPKKAQPFVPYSDSDEDSDPEAATSATSDEEYTYNKGTAKNAATNPRDRPKKTPAPPSRRFNGSQSGSGAASTNFAQDRPDMQQRQSGTNMYAISAASIRSDETNSLTVHRFNVPFNFAATADNVKSRSEETINTTFSPEGWSGTFQGSTDYFSTPKGSRKTSPSRRNGQKSTSRSATADVPASSSATPEAFSTNVFGTEGTPTKPARTESPAQHTFSHEQWQNAFKDGTWAFPGSAASASGTESKAGAGTQEDPHVVSDDGGNDAPTGTNGTRRQSAPVVIDLEPMDIDTPPPAGAEAQQSEEQPSTQPQQEPRLYSVPPSMWRQQQTQQAKEARRASVRRPQRQTMDANLDDLAGVEPIGKSSDSGLRNLADLSSTLPFESAPSSTLPSQPMEPQQLQLPPVPSPPTPATHLTKFSWQQHVNNFARYIAAFHVFNRTMLAHFDAREKQCQAIMSTGMGWLEAAGDVSGGVSGGGGLTGFGGYLKGIREDEAVRETWRLGCERHADAVKDFERLREQVRRLVALGTLPET